MLEFIYLTETEFIGPIIKSKIGIRLKRKLKMLLHWLGIQLMIEFTGWLFYFAENFFFHKIFWKYFGKNFRSDIREKKIFSATRNGTNMTAFIAEGLDVTEGISIDWVARNLYWVDSSLNTIEVASLDRPSARFFLL